MTTVNALHSPSGAES